MIYFQPLKKEEIVSIVSIMLKDFNERLLERKILISMTQDAKEYMAEIGYDSAFGARPLRRIFQKELEDYMATQLLTGAYKMPTIIKVDAKDKKFTFDEQPWEDYGLEIEEKKNENKEVVPAN